MNDMSDFRAANSGGPSAPTGAARMMPWLRTVATGGLIVGLGMYAAQLFLPYNYKPSVVMGRAAADTEQADVLAKQATVIAYERGKADAVAQASAKAQVDLAVMQTTLDTTTQSLMPVANMAGVADAACLLSQAVAALSAPTGQVTADWRGYNHGDTLAEANHAAKAVAGVACGVGPILRQDVQSAQLAAVRAVGAARGMQMTNGAVQVASAPDPAQVTEAQPIEVKPVAYQHGILDPSIKDYAFRQPPEVYASFAQDLPSDGHFWPMFYERVAVYRAAHPGT